MTNSRKGKQTKYVGQPGLTNSEGKNLVEGFFCCMKLGFPLRKNGVRDFAKVYLNRAGRSEK